MGPPHVDSVHRSSAQSFARLGFGLLASIALALALVTTAVGAAGHAPSFAAPETYRTGKFPLLQIADLNGDGKPDVVTANGGRNTNTVSVFLNAGDGSFPSRHDFATGRDPRSLAVADLNGDGKPDFASPYVGAVSVLLNRGGGSFAPFWGYATGGDPSSLEIADMNGDGKPDLTTLYQRYSVDRSTISVLLNDGRGHFLPRTDYRTGGGAYSKGQRPPIRVADLNGDGRPDVVTSDGEHSFSVLVNTPGLCNVQHVEEHGVYGLGSKRLTVAAARRKLARVNCAVGRVLRVHSRLKAGRVIRTKPGFGAVRPGGTKVDLVVSKGRKH